MIFSNSLKAMCRKNISKITGGVLVPFLAASLFAAPAAAFEDDIATSTTSAASTATSASAAASSASANSDGFRLNDHYNEAQSEKITTGISTNSDEKFRALHSAWGGALVSKPANLSIPSIDPVSTVDISSYYGYRSDPFKGRRKNHKGLDIRGPVGTPIYATADGFVKTSKWLGGYGRFIELDHGNAIHTRYGHMSKLIAEENQFVKKGDIIGLMGSTGRSTGSHLHYEVRIEGEPVNPQSFMANASNGAVNLAQVDDEKATAQGGPAQ